MTREALECDICPVRQRAACAALDDRERRELATLGHRRRLSRGETLFGAGEDNRLTATLVTGVLKVSRFAEDGSEQILSLIHPAGFTGELFTPVANHDVVALTEAELCVFPRERYEAALERFPALGRALLRRSTEALSESRNLLSTVSRRTAAERVAGFLLALGHAANDAACHPARSFDLVLTRGEMASLLGLTIETVSRRLTALERDGIIRRHGARGIELLDAARLGNLAA